MVLSWFGNGIRTAKIVLFIQILPIHEEGVKHDVIRG